MPNWTSNRIRVEGEEADIRAFLDSVRSQDQIFDFNSIIPMPDLLKRTASGRCTIDGKDVTSWYVIPGSEDVPQKDRLFTPEEEAALKDIGYSNWYDWSIVNWGTKWNACHPAIAFEGTMPSGQVEITFDTAWDAPIPVFRKIARTFPTLTFEFEWHNEGDPNIYSLSIEVDDEEQGL